MINYFSQKSQIFYVRTTYEIRSNIALHPELFFLLVKLKPKSRSIAVGKHTELVIEGFPRSANSFAVGAFRSAQSRPIEIATHLHAPAQIILAARYNIPTLLLIRYPVDAVLSFKSSFPDSQISLKQLFRYYILFYQKLLPYRDGYVLSYFENAIKDFGLEIEKINLKFNTRFERFKSTEENIQKIFKSQGEHSGPSSQRRELKRILAEKLEVEPLKQIVDRAIDVYRQFK